MVRRFNENHPDKKVSHQHVRHLIYKIQTTGFANSIKYEVNSPVRNEASVAAAFGDSQMEPTQSTRKIYQGSRVLAFTEF